MPTPNILVVGSGSVGRRHAKNFQSLGARITCFDPRSDRLLQIKEELPQVETHDALGDLISRAGFYSGVVIASPPSFHVSQCQEFLRCGVPILLEKPVSPDLESARRLESTARTADVPVLLGYTYRWWPPLIELRRRLASGALGPLRHARFVMSAHLADWHPWERYQDFFMSSRELGGGALLDESHFVDLMLWLFGMPDAISGRVEHLSSLEISTDDNVDLTAIFPDRFRVTIHLDLYGRPHEKSITVVGENGTLQCLFDPNVLRYSTEAGGQWNTVVYQCERNNMFVAEAQEFLSVAAKSQPPSCTITDGVQVLRCIEAVRLSTREQRTIPLMEVSGGA